MSHETETKPLERKLCEDHLSSKRCWGRKMDRFFPRIRWNGRLLF